MNKKKIWHALEVTARAEAAEAIEFALDEFAAIGTEISQFDKKNTPDVIVIGYFEEKPDKKSLGEKLIEALRIYDLAPDAIKKSVWREIENQDWLAEWKKHWRPTETAKFIVAAPWAELAATDKIVIRIEPSMAFGTGTHETTRLCLKAIEENFQAGESFFDVGTGTGILAIAAAKINLPNEKGGTIRACDTDADSIRIAAENAAMNRVENRLEIYVGSIVENSAAADFVCANLTADVIAPILPLLVEKTRRMLILSGILVEQKELILNELKKQKIENPHIETDGEWISVAVEK